MKYRLSNLPLIIFHPLIIPTLLMVMIFKQPVFYSMLLPLKTKLIISGIIFIGTCLFPVIFYFLYKNNYPASVPAQYARDRRIYPVFLSSVMIFLTYYFLTYVDMPRLFTMPVLFLAMVAAVALILNFWWNVSVEMLGWGAFFGAVLSSSLFLDFMVLPPLIGSLLISGITGYFLLKAEKYSESQIYISWFAGLMLMLPAFFLV